MKDRLFNLVPVFMILVIVFTSITNKVNLNESNIKNEILKAANTNEVIDTNLDLPILEDGFKKVDIFVDGSRLSFDKSNTITELDYTTVNKINMSDKSKWSVITDNLVENNNYSNGVINLNDNKYNSISISFIYEDDEYNFTLIKGEEGYVLVKSNIKLIHGNINSLWYQYFYDLNTAIKAANQDDTIILYDDIEVNNTININKSINIISNTNINTIKSNKGFLFNLTGSNINLNITNVLLDTDSFIKGKFDKNNILLDNSKVVYKSKIYSNKSFKNIIKPSDKNIFIKASL